MTAEIGQAQGLLASGDMPGLLWYLHVHGGALPLLGEAAGLLAGAARLAGSGDLARAAAAVSGKCEAAHINRWAGNSGADGRCHFPLTERQARLLAVVAEGGGDWDARRVDLTVNSRYGPGEGTVLQELQELQQLGLAVRDDSGPGAGGRWTVTTTARPYIR